MRWTTLRRERREPIELPVELLLTEGDDEVLLKAQTTDGRTWFIGKLQRNGTLLLYKDLAIPGIRTDAYGRILIDRD